MDLFAEIYDLVLDALGSMQSENILPKNIIPAYDGMSFYI